MGRRRTSKAPARTKRTDDVERDRWAAVDPASVAWAQAARGMLPHLTASTRTISLRLSESMLHELQLLASQHDVPYQSFLKLVLAERIRTEQARTRVPARWRG